MNEICPEIKDVTLAKEVRRLLEQEPFDKAKYYHMLILGNEDGSFEMSVTSQWAGYTTKPRREIRKPRYVYPDKMLSLFRSVNEFCVIVNDLHDFYIYFLIGGHGIIEENLAKTSFPDWFAAEPCVRSFTKGFLVLGDLPEQKKNRATTPKVRMAVLKRDKYRCRICGRSSNDDVDIELNVHHILPWGIGGITEEDNLITLCHTCHRGLDPHYDRDLFELLGFKELQDASFDDNSFRRRLQLYVASSPPLKLSARE